MLAQHLVQSGGQHKAEQTGIARSWKRLGYEVGMALWRWDPSSQVAECRSGQHRFRRCRYLGSPDFHLHSARKCHSEHCEVRCRSSRYDRRCARRSGGHRVLMGHMP